METDSNPCITTVDSEGIPYNDRLKRVRKSSGKSPEDVAALLGITFPEYDEWESYAGELTRVMSLGELSKLSSVLETRTSRIFDDKSEDGPRITPEQLCAKINAHLNATGVSIAEFENRVGFEIEPSLKDVAKVMDWNVDCLRFVCAEIGVNWLDALP